MKRKGTKEEIFTFKQIKELIDYNINARGDRFANDLIKMSKKMNRCGTGGVYKVKREQREWR